MLLIFINTFAYGIIFATTFWVLFTNRIPTKMGGSAILMAVAFGAFGNLVNPYPDYSDPETLFNVSIAALAVWAFWKLEVKDGYIGHL